MRALLLALSVASIVGAQALIPHLEKAAPARIGQVGEGGVLLKPSVLKVVALGFDNLLADLYYMKSIQYFGVKDSSREPMVHMYSLINAAVSLDPKFDFAYRFGWTALMYNDSRGEEANLEEADDLISRGAKNCSESYRANFTYAFHLFYYMEDYGLAADYLDKTTSLTGVSAYAILAGRLRAQAGSPDVSIEFLERMLSEEKDPRVKEKLARRILELKGHKVILGLEKVAGKFLEDNGRYPADINELVSRGYISRVPEEPFGGEFVLDPVTGEASSTVFGRLKLYRNK